MQWRAGRRRHLWIALGATAIWATAACGADDTAEEPDITQPPAAEEPAASDEPAPAGGSDSDSEGGGDAPEPSGIARAAITQDDLGDPWLEHTEAEGTATPGDDHCAGDVLDALEELYFGAIFQRGDDGAFSRTHVYDFADESGALAFVDALRGDAYQQCRTAQLVGDESVEGAAYRLREVGDAAGEGEEGFELQLSYQFQALVDGEIQDANGYTEELVFRRGSLVSVGIVEWVFAEESPEDLGERALSESDEAIRAALDRAGAG